MFRQRCGNSPGGFYVPGPLCSLIRRGSVSRMHSAELLFLARSRYSPFSNQHDRRKRVVSLHSPGLFSVSSACGQLHPRPQLPVLLWSSQPTTAQPALPRESGVSGRAAARPSDRSPVTTEWPASGQSSLSAAAAGRRFCRGAACTRRTRSSAAQRGPARRSRRPHELV